MFRDSGDQVYVRVPQKGMTYSVRNWYSQEIDDPDLPQPAKKNAMGYCDEMFPETFGRRFREAIGQSHNVFRQPVNLPAMAVFVYIASYVGERNSCGTKWALQAAKMKANGGLQKHHREPLARFKGYHVITFGGQECLVEVLIIRFLLALYQHDATRRSGRRVQHS